jgi:hypothetical protein
LRLKDTEKHYYYISIHASTLEEAIICLDYLVDLKNTHSREMGLTCEEDMIGLCPFGANILEKILQNSARRISFSFMIFNLDHCRTLATSGIETNIAFYDCEFQDEGAAFVEASASRQDETSGPAKLRFRYSLPFNDRNWALFLSQRKLESLDLDFVEFSSESLVTAKVQCLTLGSDYRFGDEGAALTESVRQGLGPKGLCFLGNPFDSSERLVTFMNALRGNTYLERLDIVLVQDRQVTQALATTLRENKGLVHLRLEDCEVEDRNELLESVSMHPSLRSLDLCCPRIHTTEKEDFTKAEQKPILNFTFANFKTTGPLL